MAIIEMIEMEDALADLHFQSVGSSAVITMVPSLFLKPFSSMSYPDILVPTVVFPPLKLEIGRAHV